MLQVLSIISVKWRETRIYVERSTCVCLVHAGGKRDKFFFDFVLFAPSATAGMVTRGEVIIIEFEQEIFMFLCNKLIKYTFDLYYLGLFIVKYT